MIRHPWPLPLKATGHEPAPDEQAEAHRVIAFPSQARREALKFPEIDLLALQQLGAALVCAQDRQEALEREEAAAKVRHEI